MISGFSHVTVSCSDIEQSVDFYTTLGLRLVRHIGELDSAGVAKAFALPRGHLTVVHLAPSDADGSVMIDLVQWLDPLPGEPAYSRLDSLGINRIAFRVDDIDGTVEKLRNAGVEFLTDTVEDFGRGVRSIVTRDPDGTFLQLIEGLDAMQPR
jgi:glyoxylase I family protein